jgi:hypothetical protein
VKAALVNVPQQLQVQLVSIGAVQIPKSDGIFCNVNTSKVDGASGQGTQSTSFNR